MTLRAPVQARRVSRRLERGLPLTRPADEGTPPSPPTSPPPKADLPPVDDASTPLDRARMVAEVMDYVVRLARATPRVLPRPRVWIPILTVLSFGFMLYSYAVKPEWIWGPRVDPAEVTAKKNADMRFAMFLLAQRILDYRREFGTVPQTLAQVGDKIDGVRYVVLSDTSFSLRYEGPVPIILYSTESMDDFMRNTLQLIMPNQTR